MKTGSNPAEVQYLYAGTHAKAHHADPVQVAYGIYHFQSNGQCLIPAGMTPTIQPGWICESPTGRALYAVNEVKEMDGRAGGAITAFAKADDGTLAPLGSMPLPPMPCYCSVDPTGRFLFAATFGGGSVHLFGLTDDGSIAAELDRHVHTGSSAHPKRQTSPHAHAAVLSPEGRFLLVPDLGTDRLVVYRFDAEAGKLVHLPDRTVQMPPLSGPRHVVFTPSTQGMRAYLINEMSASIATFGWDGESGTLTLLQTVDLLPETFDGLRSGGAIDVHPSLPFLFATTRSHGSSGLPDKPGVDQLCWCRIDPTTGALALAGCVPSGGGIPRSFAFDPANGDILVGHQCSGTIVRFRIDRESGAPSPAGEPVLTPVPVCLHFG